MIKVDDIPEDQLLFYDIETDSQFAPYTNLKMIGVQIGWEKPFLVETWGQRKRFREMLADKDVIKVQFNGVNFDDLVLWRHGYPVNEENRHDCFLMAKVVNPRLPAYTLKFINWYYFCDFHQPEMDLLAWLKEHNEPSMWRAPKELLGPYCLYDVHPQTTNLFTLFWEIVQRPIHWSVYSTLELPAALPMEEIMLRGGEYLDRNRIEERLNTLVNDRLGWEDEAWNLTDGRVQNPNSVKQVGAYLQDEEGIELELTENGNFQLKKTDLQDFIDLENPDKDKSRIMRCLHEVRQINSASSYLRNYKEALDHPNFHDKDRPAGWIPKQYSLSMARTRRILSNSFYKINFQNPTDSAKEVQLVPPGWLGWWADATQVENVVHIYESGDTARREAYEADPDWNEYVWLCCQVLGVKKTKAELEDLTSPINALWSVYKQYKTVKLSMNFGMGVTKYCKTTKMPESAGRRSFMEVQKACPAIKGLQNRVAGDLIDHGYVQDVFGHIYSAKEAYKLVAYLIQGCGTGSLPKAQIRGCYDALHKWDQVLPVKELAAVLNPKVIPQVVVDKPRGIISYGVLNGTTHDEISGRISLLLEPKQIIATLQQIMYVMTKKFSPLFDNIPLRAKLYLSRTTTVAREEVDITDLKTIRKFIK